MEANILWAVIVIFLILTGIGIYFIIKILRNDKKFTTMAQESYPAGRHLDPEMEEVVWVVQPKYVRHLALPPIGEEKEKENGNQTNR